MYDGSYAVGFFHADPYFVLWNQDDAIDMQFREYEFNLPLKELGIKGKCGVRDLWLQKDLEDAEGHIEVKVPYHGVKLLRIIPQ